MSKAKPCPLTSTGLVFQGIRMLCETRIKLDETIAAYVSGIRIEAVHVSGEFEPGDIIEFPIKYLPWTELPALIRIVRDKDKFEISTPLEISTQDQAVGLVGVGEIVVDQITIEQGSVRGIAINRINGLVSPQMFARVNGQITRAVHVSQPRFLEDGGAMFRFSAQLSSSDLRESGLTAEIFVVGEDVPVSSISYRRADLDELSRKIVMLEEGLRQVSKSIGFKISTVSTDVDRRMELIQQRVDAFIEYSSTFMFDRLSAAESPRAFFNAASSQDDQSQKMRAFQELVREASSDLDKCRAVITRQERLLVPLTSHCFSTGWHDIENDGGSTFRWMPEDAIIINPRPSLAVAAVYLTFAHVHGELPPQLNATFDTKPATVRIQRAASEEEVWGAIIEPVERSPAMTCEVLHLSSFHTSDLTDPASSHAHKIVSVAVSRVEILYEGGLPVGS